MSRKTFMLSPPTEVAEQIERLITACDVSANNLLTQLVTEALKHVKTKTRTVKEVVFDYSQE